MSDDAGEGRRARRIRQPRAGLAAVMAGVALLTAACGTGSSSPQVASLGKASGAGSGTGSGSSAGAGSPTGSPTQLLNEWAACMRSHGDPAQTDPTIDTSKVININLPSGVKGGAYGYSGEYGPGGPGLYCVKYLHAAQSALGGDRHGKKPDHAKLEEFSKCMRANGIPDFPDPTAKGLQLSTGGDINPHNPTYQKASKTCAAKTGLTGFSGTPQPGTVTLNGQTP